MAITAVFFDVGGTLVDETRMFAGWAETLDVPLLDFHAALGATIQAGEPHRRVFEMVAPGVDMAAARERRRALGLEFRIEARDLYADAVPGLAACKAAGLFVGIAGNQPVAAEEGLRGCGLAFDALAASDRWGVAKPDPAFFAKVSESCGRPPEEIAYVGDRVDNDVGPARAAGMAPVLLVRGPWGVIHAGWPGAGEAALTVRSLLGLPGLLAGL